MNKFSRKTSAVLLIAILAMTPLHIVGAGQERIDSLNDYLVSNFGYEFVQNHNLATEMVEDLYNFLPRTRMGEVMYPNYFGGRYINEYGELVILSVENVIQPRNSTIARLNSPVTREVQFSFRELLDVMDYLDGLVSNNGQPVNLINTKYGIVFEQQDLVLSNYIYNVSGWGLDIASNRIVVELIEYSEEAIEEFKSSVLNSEVIEFKQGDLTQLNNYFNMKDKIDELNRTGQSPIVVAQNIRTLSNLRTGDRIWVYRAGQGWLGGLGIGYRAQLIERHELPGGGGVTIRHNGFITAAHAGISITGMGMQNGDIITDENRVRIGTVHGTSLQSFDASFIRLDNSGSLSGTSSEPGNLLFAGIQGQMLMMNGGTSGLRSGFVMIERHTSSLRVPESDLIVTINNAIRSSHLSQGGDSGSVVYAIAINPQNGATNIIGIAGIAVAAAAAHTVVSRADHINTMFDGASINPSFRIELR